MTHYLLSVSNSYEQIFSLREFRGFFELKKSALRRTKKELHQRVLTECFEKHLRKKDMVLFGFSKKKLFGTLPPLLNKPMGFVEKRLEKQFKDSP